LVTDNRPETVPVGLAAPLARSPAARWAIIIARLLLGYIVAVAAGAVVFSIVINTVSLSDMFSPMITSASKWLIETAKGSLMLFVLGLCFGLPYTILGSLIFWFALPRNGWTLMAVGVLCPPIAIFTVGLLLGGTFWWDREILKLSLMTLPAGFAATYLFGAIGFGLGFRRWRFA
jgi:hypothetical protein